jgi:antitoxin ParD1/3/4
MPETVKRTFSLTAEQSAFIDQQVERGAYATASEVVRDGLRELQEHDAVIEKWLRDEVMPTLERMDADPSRGIPAEKVRKHLEEVFEQARKQERQRRA